MPDCVRMKLRMRGSSMLTFPDGLEPSPQTLVPNETIPTCMLARITGLPCKFKKVIKSMEKLFLEFLQSHRCKYHDY